MYLDTNIFVEANRRKGPEGNTPRELLERLRDGTLRAATSTLTIDEVVWVLMRLGDRSQAIQQGERILNLPNLHILDVRPLDVSRALRIMQKHGLDPRDAIHAATALNADIRQIASDDTDFDRVPKLSRVTTR